MISFPYIETKIMKFASLNMIKKFIGIFFQQFYKKKKSPNFERATKTREYDGTISNKYSLEKLKGFNYFKK
jgi:hypothetical protein